MSKVIFIFRHYANIPYLPGGERLFKIGKLMVKNGNSVFIFISNFKHNTKKYAKKFKGLYQIEYYEGVNFVWINNKPSYSKNDWRRLLGMLDYSLKAFWVAIQLQKISVKPDLIIGSVAHIFAVLSAYCSSVYLKSTFWIDLGDLWPASYIESGIISKNHPIAILMSSLASVLYKKARKIIVLSRNAKEFLLNINVPSDKIILFSNGIINQHAVCFSESHAALIESTTAKPNFKISYTGSLDETHPLDVLIEAAVILREKNITLDVEIVGDGLKKIKYQQMIQQYGLSNVKIYGPVKREVLSDIYQNSDALIVIEKNCGYGFPNKLIDYSIAGKPVIIASGLPYGLPDELYIQTKPDADRISEAIIKLYKLSPLKRQKIGIAICQYALNNFNMQKNYIVQIQPLINSL